MIGIISVIVVIFSICVFFYKRAQEEIHILQVEAGNIDKLGKLLGELDPVVGRGFKEPPVWKREEVEKGRLGALVSAGLRADETEKSKKLAEESGLRVWIEHSIVPKLVAGSLMEYIGWSECFARIGGRKLWKTCAYTTVIIPCDSVLTVTLMANKNEAFLPVGSWKGRDPNDFKRERDGPMVGNLQMVDVIVRPGSFLCVPPHWFVSVAGGETAYWAQIEIHHCVSWIQERIEGGLGVEGV